MLLGNCDLIITYAHHLVHTLPIPVTTVLNLHDAQDMSDLAQPTRLKVGSAIQISKEFLLFDHSLDSFVLHSGSVTNSANLKHLWRTGTM